MQCRGASSSFFRFVVSLCVRCCVVSLLPVPLLALYICMSLCESVCGGIFTRFLLLLYLWFYLIFSSLPMNHFLPSHLHVFTFRHRLPVSLLMPRSWWLLVCRNAWWCFPFEAMEALSCHLMWVAAATYCSILAPKSLLATLIGVLGMAHFSLGKCNYTLFQMRISIFVYTPMEIYGNK